MAESQKIYGYEITALPRDLWIVHLPDTNIPIAYSELKQLEACNNKEAFDQKLAEIRAYEDLSRALVYSATIRMGGKLDYARLKTQIADRDGVRNAVDDLLTNKNTDNRAMEDTHEELP